MHEIYVHVKPFFGGIHITKLDVQTNGPLCHYLY